MLPVKSMYEFIIILVGSCMAKHTGCCVGDDCSGEPPNCYCDAQCSSLGDCCGDVSSTCSEGRQIVL